MYSSGFHHRNETSQPHRTWKQSTSSDKVKTPYSFASMLDGLCNSLSTLSHGIHSYNTIHINGILSSVYYGHNIKKKK